MKQGRDTESREFGRRAFLTAVGAGATTALAGCAGGSGEETSTGETPAGGGAQGQSKGGTLRVANESNLTSLDPHETASVVSWNVIYNICETLTTFEDGALAGRLAKDWQIGDGGKTYTFTLEKGAKFHPPVDRELVADDVVYSFERMRSETAQMSGDANIIREVKAVDDRTVEFTLEHAFAPFANFLARIGWVIVPKEAVEAQGGKIGDFQEPVGTGPFVFEEHRQGDHLTMSAFDGYREEGVPSLDDVRLIPIPDADSRVLALRKGDVEFVRGTPGKDATSLADREEIRIIESEATAWGEVYINNSRPPWNDPAVRRAVAHVVSREAIVAAGLYGYGSPAHQPFPERSFWHTNLDSPRERDVEEARRILEDAGNPQEGETLEIKTTSAYQLMESTAEILVNNLNEAGIDAKMNRLEWGTMLNDFLTGNFDAMAFSVPTKVDPDRYYYNFIHPDGPQYLKYGEDQPDAKRMYELVAKGRVETDREKRKALYDELQNLVVKNVPWVSIAHSSTVLGIRETVEGDPTWLLPYNRFWKLSMQ